jgi:hypothetical protein
MRQGREQQDPCRSTYSKIMKKIRVGVNECEQNDGARGSVKITCKKGSALEKNRC